MKLIRSAEQLRPMMAWVDGVPLLVQIGGATLHLRRGEIRVLGLNVALLVLAAVEIWPATVWL